MRALYIFLAPVSERLVLTSKRYENDNGNLPSQGIASSPELIVRQLPKQKSMLGKLPWGGCRRHLGVQIVVVIHSSLGRSPERRSIWPLNVQRSVATCGVLVDRVELLPELVEFRQVVAGHGAPSSGKSLLEMPH